MGTHLVLGGSGFTGRHVALRLAEHGSTVVVAGRNTPPKPPRTLAVPWSFEHFSLDNGDYDRLIEDVDMIYHFAWSTIPKSANEAPIDDLDTNVRGTLRLLEAMRRRGGGIIVFASSGGTVYGPSQTTPLSEDHPCRPITAYGVSKLAVENYLSLYRFLHGIDARVARISNPYGAGQDTTRGQGAVSVFLQRALRGEKITIWGNGSTIRDYIHISDLTNGLIALAKSVRNAQERQSVFNIGSGIGISLTGIVETLETTLGRKLNVEYLPPRAFDVPINVLDTSRAHTLLGWQCRLNFVEGIAAAVSDVEAGRNYATF